MELLKRILSTIFVGLIKVYQGAISPYLMPSCRYTPTCSQYGLEAIRKYGPFKGGMLAVKRFLSCHPWGGFGEDQVP